MKPGRCRISTPVGHQLECIPQSSYWDEAERPCSTLRSHNEETRELAGERDNARNNARCTKARKATHGLMDNIKTWTGLTVEESIRMTEDRDKWSEYVHGVANHRIEDG